MPGLSARLPLARDEQDGIGLIKEFRDLIKQNLLNVIMTIPGERMMHTDFGVGLKSFLFENDNNALRSEISSRIRTQVNKHLPYVSIINIDFQSKNQNDLSISLEYNIIPLGINDNISITREDNNIIVF